MTLLQNDARHSLRILSRKLLELSVPGPSRSIPRPHPPASNATPIGRAGRCRRQPPQCLGCLLPPQPLPPRPPLRRPFPVSSAPSQSHHRRVVRPPSRICSDAGSCKCTAGYAFLIYSPAAAPHATYSSPSTRSTTIPFRYAVLPKDIHTVFTKLGFRWPSSSPPIRVRAETGPMSYRGRGRRPLKGIRRVLERIGAAVAASPRF